MRIRIIQQGGRPPPDGGTYPIILVSVFQNFKILKIPIFAKIPLSRYRILSRKISDRILDQILQEKYFSKIFTPRFCKHSRISHYEFCINFCTNLYLQSNLLFLLCKLKSQPGKYGSHRRKDIIGMSRFSIILAGHRENTKPKR
jgi:hypothetical protein